MEHSPTIRKPRALRAGSRVALVAPAGPVTAERLQISQERCVQLDLEPIVFPAALEQQRFLAGPDANRLRDLQSAFDADDIDAVWALRGGYGTTRILSQLDLTTLQRTPKPFIGFSDNTAIHVRMFAHGLVSFHGPHPGAAFPVETEAAFRKILFECEPAGLLPRRSEDPPPRIFRSMVSVFAGYWKPSLATRFWVSAFFGLVRIQRWIGFAPAIAFKSAPERPQE